MSPPSLADRWQVIRMADDQKDFDLEPHNWNSEREKPKEPIFGPGWPIAVAVIAGIAIAAALADQSIALRVFGSAIGAALAGVATAYIQR